MFAVTCDGYRLLSDDEFSWLFDDADPADAARFTSRVRAERVAARWPGAYIVNWPPIWVDGYEGYPWSQQRDLPLAVHA